MFQTPSIVVTVGVLVIFIGVWKEIGSCLGIRITTKNKYITAHGVYCILFVKNVYFLK